MDEDEDMKDDSEDDDSDSDDGGKKPKKRENIFKKIEYVVSFILSKLGCCSVVRSIWLDCL